MPDDRKPWPNEGRDPAPLLLIDLGVSDYAAVYEMQQDLVQKKRTGAVLYDYLIFVEHPDVYTYGRRSKEKPEQYEPLDSSETFFVERGGEVTFHNPGQLVCYPILTLRENERDLPKYLRALEETLIRTLNEFELDGVRREGLTGVWLEGQDKKIASIGVAASAWITFHGTALNVSNDLSGFKKVKPCGLDANVMTSIQTELGPERTPSLNEVKDVYLRHFCRELNRVLMA